PSASKANACHFLERLMTELPFKIHTILTDNGSCFTNRWYAPSRGGATQEHDFTMLCQTQGITHRLTKPYHPWTNGLVENANKQIKANTTKRHSLRSYTQAKECIQTYALYHNH